MKAISIGTFSDENVEELVKRLFEMNLYGYAGNNPLSNVDPSGQAAQGQGGVYSEAFTKQLQNDAAHVRANTNYVDIPKTKGAYVSKEITRGARINRDVKREISRMNEPSTRQKINSNKKALPYTLIAAGSVGLAVVSAPVIVKAAVGCAFNPSCNQKAVDVMSGVIDPALPSNYHESVGSLASKIEAPDGSSSNKSNEE
jgi:hypothetical protein